MSEEMSPYDYDAARDFSARYAPAVMWAEDFAKALEAQPRLLRWIAYRAMGRFARRELRGMVEALEDAGCVMSVPYACEDYNYHKDSAP